MHYLRSANRLHEGRAVNDVILKVSWTLPADPAASFKPELS
jgi:hypothetical protein